MTRAEKWMAVGGVLLVVGNLLARWRERRASADYIARKPLFGGKDWEPLPLKLERLRLAGCVFDGTQEGM